MSLSGETDSRGWDQPLTSEEIQLQALRALIHAERPHDALGLLAGWNRSVLDARAHDLIRRLMAEDDAEAFGD